MVNMWRKFKIESHNLAIFSETEMSTNRVINAKFVVVIYLFRWCSAEVGISKHNQYMKYLKKLLLCN